MTEQGYFNLKLLTKLHVNINGRKTQIQHLLQLLGDGTYEYLIINNARFSYPRANNSMHCAWMPQLTENDYLIIGHCHVCFRLEKWRVLSPGTWKGDPRDDPNVGWYIMIKTTQVCDEIKLRCWFSLDPKRNL